MPIYEYRRPDGSTFEVVQSFSDDPLMRDPDTGVPVERVLHAPAVHFKGKGFYNTDYGTRKRQRETAAAASSNGSSESSESSSSGRDSSGEKGSSGASAEGAGKSEGAGTSDASAKDKSSKSKDAKKPVGAGK